MDPSPHPDRHIRRYILESASRDPRYTILLPLLFTVPEELPAPGVADILDRMFAAEAKYPASLQHLFNPCIQIDARGIAPFLPYIIRSDLIRLLGDGPFSTCSEELDSPQSVGTSEHISDGVIGAAPKEGDHSSTAMLAIPTNNFGEGGRNHGRFMMVAIPGIITAFVLLVAFMAVCLAGPRFV